MFSKRVVTETGPHRSFRALVEQQRQAGVRLYDLTVSNPLAAGIDYDWEALRGALNTARFDTYSPDAAGCLLAREAIARHLHEVETPADDGFVDLGRSMHYQANRLVLTASTSEAYSFLFRMLCDPGQAVLAPEPSYPLFEQLAALDAIKLVPYRLEYDGEWFIDFDSVRQGMQQRPRAILLVAPNNPTGSCITQSEFEQLRALNVPMIADHVFAPYVRYRHGLQSLAPGATDDGLLFTLDGLSKRCGLPQLKLGWIAVSGNPQKVEQALLGLHQIADAFLSPSAITQGAANGILTASNVALGSIRRRLRQNLDSLLAAIAAGLPISCCHYQGGWSVLLRFPVMRTDDEWAHFCLTHGVLLQPGWLYDCTLASTLVASLLVPPDEFTAALAIFARVL